MSVAPWPGSHEAPAADRDRDAQPIAIAAEPVNGAAGFLSHPVLYSWLVGLAILDVWLTSVILAQGGRELNHLANIVLQQWGVTGLAVLKVMMLALVVPICELVVRLRPRTGRRLAEWLVALSAIPVTVATAQLLAAFGI